MSYAICPICHGKVQTIFRSKEELSAVLERHMRTMHVKDGWLPVERWDETTQQWSWS